MFIAHSTRHPDKGYSRAEVLYSFGRRDQLDVEAIKRLVGSLCRFISPEDALKFQGEATGGLSFISSKPVGGAHLLKGLWERLNIGSCLNKALKDRSFTALPNLIVDLIFFDTTVEH